MKSFTSVFLFLILFGLNLSARTLFIPNVPEEILIKNKVDSLLNLMTLEEKVGQLNQYSWNFIHQDSILNNFSGDLFRQGRVGSVFNVNGIELLTFLQSEFLKVSRLKIPLIFAGDVGHGFVTEFPIPLAESCSWDLDLIQQTTRIAALEASASGICWTFAPMVDLSRDPRWGRVQEGAGEDPYLASLVAAARVKGYQKKSNSNFFLDEDAMFATAKHFAAYGAAQAGRDYHTVDISERTLFESYLPPFQAAINVEVASVMTAFNDLNGFPCTGNKYLLKDVLRKKMGFDGLLVSDYTAINELVNHGFAENPKHAAELAMSAGVDVDMIGESFVQFIPQLINEGKLNLNQIDSAVAKILELKYRAGLFENPYKYLNLNRRDSLVLNPSHLKAALKSAQNSIVLLKNNGVLPVNPSKKIAVIGPHSASEFFMPVDYKSIAMNGSYTQRMKLLDSRVNIVEWLKMSDFQISGQSYGCSLFPDNDSTAFKKALDLAENSDIILAVMGEDKSWSGEGNSRSEITLPGNQRKLLQYLKKAAKPVVLLLLNGRPLDLSWEDKNVDAIIEAWFPGAMGGEAICQILNGAVNPSAKLSMTFPRNAGQIPIYYNSKLFYSQIKDEDPFQDYQSRYLDTPNSPLYPFGFGLNYSNINYSNLRTDKLILHADEKLHLKINLNNIGKYDAEEIVQLYIRLSNSEFTSPVKSLRKFARKTVKATENVDLEFELDKSDLVTLDKNLNWTACDGEYILWISSSSEDEKNFVKIKYFN